MKKKLNLIEPYLPGIVAASFIVVMIAVIAIWNHSNPDILDTNEPGTFIAQRENGELVKVKKTDDGYTITKIEDEEAQDEATTTNKEVIEIEAKPMTEEHKFIFNEEGKTHPVKTIDKYKLETCNAAGGPYENDMLYQNYACPYSVVVPAGYSVEIQKNNTVCIRDNEARTQVAIIYVPGRYGEAIDVWNAAAGLVYNITCLLEDNEGDIEEKRIVSYNSSYKSTVYIGDYEVKEDLGKLCFRNIGEEDYLENQECGYYTTLANGAGLILIGTSQTENYQEVYKLMDQILASIS